MLQPCTIYCLSALFTSYTPDFKLQMVSFMSSWIHWLMFWAASDSHFAKILNPLPETSSGNDYKAMALSTGNILAPLMLLIMHASCAFWHATDSVNPHRLFLCICFASNSLKFSNMVWHVNAHKLSSDEACTCCLFLSVCLLKLCCEKQYCISDIFITTCS